MPSLYWLSIFGNLLETRKMAQKYARPALIQEVRTETKKYVSP